MKHLLWLSLATLGLGVLALWLRPHSTPVLHVARSPELEDAPASRCPRHTLEDDGVCIPVPRLHPPSKALPDGKYVLPVLGRATLVPAERAPLPDSIADSLRDDTPTLLLRTRPGSQVSCTTALHDARIVNIAAASLTIAGELAGGPADADAGAGTVTVQLTFAGFQTISEKLSPGSACGAETHLGLSRDVLVLFSSAGSDAGADTVPLHRLLAPSAKHDASSAPSTDNTTPAAATTP